MQLPQYISAAPAVRERIRIVEEFRIQNSETGPVLGFDSECRFLDLAF
jgi:hypothetical protein